MDSSLMESYQWHKYLYSSGYTARHFKTQDYILSLETRKFLRSREWQTHTLAQSQTKDAHISTLPHTPPPPSLPPHTHACIMPIYCCEDLSTPSHWLWSMWSLWKDEKNTVVWKVQLGQHSVCKLWPSDMPPNPPTLLGFPPFFLLLPLPTPVRYLCVSWNFLWGF